MKKSTQGRSLVPAQKTITHNQPLYIPLFLADPTQKKQVVWELAFEDGSRDSGKAKRNAINIPKGLPVGKHKFTIIAGEPLLSKGHKLYYCDLTVTP
ncbi:hypothetical protein [Frederiksenia canicola]|uniref:MalQ N-terminal beta-sandwich domain-containing protein n=1 Tax=Frederiksenia canicola TaxID=123824 RepID=A0AAE6X6M8_9PAST|nr:hypothetical protein [Frederiksenia canicola]QIM65047.1 hypothetical protein A4G17_06165 [Frederiksenia canicola]RPE96540.1 hypothetical protein EDC49_0935 [Frederiksenia canicola]